MLMSLFWDTPQGFQILTSICTYIYASCHLRKTMQSVRAYLESSTIHGLSYISTTRKCSRIFWLVIVIAGFSGAGVLIYNAFQSWALSPISTSEETLPMEQIKFPKVTVCPPKNTFTDLNYDLM